MKLRFSTLALALSVLAAFCSTTAIAAPAAQTTVRGPVPSQTQPASPIQHPATPATPPSGLASTPPISASGSADKSLLQASKEALPTLLGAILLAFLGWAIGLRLTAGWDLRKKRQELDVAAIVDFNRVVAEFKAIGRERELLIARPPTADQTRTAALLELHKRAVAAESSLEVILLKLLVDSDAWLTAHDAAHMAELKQRQIHVFALFRLMFRTMRESIMEPEAPPGFLNPELWLFNRLAAEVAGIVYERAANPAIPPLWAPWRITAAVAKPDPSAYLKLVSYRTTDLRQAIAAINPALRDYGAARTTARASGRRANIESLFDPTKTSILDDPNLEQAAPGPEITTVVQFVQPLLSEDAPAGLEGLFGRRPNLAFYLAVTDQPPRLLLVKKGVPPRVLNELSPLPDSLPFAQPGPARYGIDILRWEPSREVNAALERIATAPLSFSPPGAPDPNPPPTGRFPALASGYIRRNAVSPPP